MSVQTEDDAILAGLTAEERAALAEPEEGDPNATQGELEDKTGEQPKTAAKEIRDAVETPKTGDDGNGDSGTAAVDAPAAAAAAAPAQAAAAAVDEPSAAPGAPIFVAQAPADAEAKLADIAAKKAELRKGYDDGDITFEDYESKKDILDDQRMEITRAVDKAQLANDMEQQRQKNEWFATAAAFVAANGYKGNARLERALDQEVRDVAGTPEFKDRTDAAAGAAILAKAHANLVEAGMVKPTAQAGKGPKAPTPPALPPNIGSLPAAAGNDPGEGKYASLDRLMNTNPAAYEAALAKMSPEEQDAYLATN